MIGSSVGYAGFKSYGDLAYPNLKAGEQNVPRNYYEEATTEKPDGAKCLTNYQRFGSDYRENVSATVKPQDYNVPCKDANHMIHYDLTHQPQLFGYTKRAQYEAATGKHTGFQRVGEQTLSGSSSHWTTTNKAEI